MKTRCPCCGAENSLDALIAHEGARQVVWAAAQVGGEVGKLAVQYIALFRPAKTALTFERMAKLLGELLPDMERGAISRNGLEYPAPPEAWLYGFRELLARRNTGSLKLPLKSHGYLYEVISGWQGQGLQTMPAAPEQRQPESSQTLNAAMTLQGLRR
ncbi:hypothetical protein [Kingella oralis]|jgi:hypothetical protein|uniref:hypothetical protein n=1 Tax=Kingella oralis TaxID=505 RepID=UPI00204E43AB|nr:hypothetical protein [Kingella oralis]DAF21298.1 MAG TPA: zinc-ribbon domain protein [Caudoviricetes sp.]DAX41092.1 MAG TPA: zinc-ribbon domain protein [Caudoviricetes sp.]